MLIYKLISENENMCPIKINFLRVFAIAACLLVTFSFFGKIFGMKKEEIEEHFFIRNYNEQEAFDYVLVIAENSLFFKSNGFDVTFPVNYTFKDLWENPEKVKEFQEKSLETEKYFKIFVSEIYKPLDISPVQKVLSENSKILLKVLERFNALNKKWGFKVFPKYEVIFTMYGPGGSYNSDFGVIVVKVNSQGVHASSEYAYDALTEIIVHEMVHIGIEKIIVQEFKLSHWEKEGLVDLICELYFGDLLSNYKLQLQGDKRIREFIKYENICDDLPEAIRKYVLKYSNP